MSAASGLDIRSAINVYNDVASYTQYVYLQIISCSLQLLVGASAGANSKGQTSLGMYSIVCTVMKDFTCYGTGLGRCFMPCRNHIH